MTIRQKIVLFILFATLPQLSWGYIDPGLAGALFQSLYVFIFGIVSAWIFRPWQYFKSLFHKKSDNKGKDKENVMDKPDTDKNEI